MSYSSILACTSTYTLQYEVVFSDSLISDTEANQIIEHASSPAHDHVAGSTNGLESTYQHSYVFDPTHETYEFMYLNDDSFFCTIPIVDTPLRDESSEAEARAAEQKELARASDRGWELLQDLGDGQCLYFRSGWWSYSYCYNAEIVQFHQMPQHPGKLNEPPQRDLTTKQYVLGRAKSTKSKGDEWGNEVDVHKGAKHGEPLKTELQVKGDTRYLVQRMEWGTTCDLTGKPRRVEVQFHCSPQASDRIGYIKEVTTCSYLMVVYTPRLCNDVAFMPPKENKANKIVCRVVVPEDDMADRLELKTLEMELDAANSRTEKPINIGGIIVGGGHWVGKEGQRMPVPASFNKGSEVRENEVIARGKSKADGGQVEMITDADLHRMDLDPAMVEDLKKELQKMAKDKGWKIEIVDAPGEVREILGIVDDDEDEDGDGDGEEGSQETFKEDL